MIIEKIIRENWLTRSPKKSAISITLFSAFTLFFLALYYLKNTFGLQEWMPASYSLVFNEHQYWRLWSTLFAHADIGHLMNNALLYIPLTYILCAYFPFWFFPLLGLVQGGLINYIVLQNMPPDSYLIGISGVVYWMGGAWLTLFVLIDKRKNIRYRLANVIFLLLMLFVPETYSPHISYLSHFIGFLLGSISAITLYIINRRQFIAAEVYEYVFDDECDPTLDQPQDHPPRLYH